MEEDLQVHVMYQVQQLHPQKHNHNLTIILIMSHQIVYKLPQIHHLHLQQMGSQQMLVIMQFQMQHQLIQH